jgi:hypothetical protein
MENETHTADSLVKFKSPNFRISFLGDTQCMNAIYPIAPGAVRDGRTCPDLTRQEHHSVQIWWVNRHDR